MDQESKEWIVCKYVVFIKRQLGANLFREHTW